VTVEAVVANLHTNVARAQDVLRRLIPRIGKPCSAGCPDALRAAIITDPRAFPARTRKRLELLIGRHVPQQAKGGRGG
jgi:hypothetical protein